MTFPSNNCPNCGHEMISSGVDMETYEQICHERDDLYEQLQSIFKFTGFKRPDEFTVLTKEELKTLYELFEHQYISYENVLAIELVRKIRRILDE